MFAPFENPTAMTRAGSNDPSRIEPMGRRRLADKRSEVGRPGDHVFDIEHAFGEPAEEAIRTQFAHVAARAQKGRSGQERSSELDQAAFVAAGPVEEEQGPRFIGSQRRFETEVRMGVCRHQPAPPPISTPFGSRRGGRRRTIASRCGSYWAGSLRWVPRSASVSSIRNPGGSVATSNSTPPGSRK